jgi:P27 family predicted phage terminase small subunit
LTDPAALKEWHRLAEMMAAVGTLTDVDQTMFAIYCEAFGQLRQRMDDFKKMADADAVTHGVVMKTREGNFIQNPMVGAINVLRRDVQRLAAEFGLTPSSRTQIATGVNSEDDAILKKYGLK